jgi:predicted DNA-binding transcriptional regulator AlpA
LTEVKGAPQLFRTPHHPPRDALETSAMPRQTEGDSDAPRNIRRMLTIDEVVRLVGLHRNTIDRYVKLEKFPQPVRPTGTVKWRRWYEDEVLAWRDGNWPIGGPRARPWNRK